MGIVLTLLAILLAVWGIVALVHGAILLGVLLLVAACAVGPGGWSIFSSNGNGRRF